MCFYVRDGFDEGKVRGGDGECQSADMNGVGVRVCLSE